MKVSVISLAITLASALVAASPQGDHPVPKRPAVVVEADEGFERRQINSNGPFHTGPAVVVEADGGFQRRQINSNGPFATPAPVPNCIATCRRIKGRRLQQGQFHVQL
ncbi:hypothetical protein LZ32DRAFT_623238 [Colletotrichum eremochloae]|nr:hypothetical protein LZ32DRAFT_623238 [Colletotrichum eremochloae]